MQDRQQHPRDRDESFRHVHVVDLAQTGPANAYVAAAMTQATVESFRARRKTYIPTAMRRKQDHLGGDPCGAVGRMTNSPVRG